MYKRQDVAFRCNLVTLRNAGGRLVMEDYSAGHISLYEGEAIVRFLDEHLGKGDISFHPGKGYRHIMVWRGGPTGLGLTPPHDIIGWEVEPYIPRGEFLVELMEESWRLLENHPANQLRRAKGRLPANSVWFWGEGKRPQMPSFKEKWLSLIHI